MREQDGQEQTVTNSDSLGGYGGAMNMIRPSTCRPAVWRFAEGFLVEHRLDGDIRVWGPWHGPFGCWAADGTAVDPEWEPLGRLGVWHEPAGPRDDVWYASRAALAAYWTQVPSITRLQVSRLGVGQWAALIGHWLASQQE
jgi:hypothetical protein